MEIAKFTVETGEKIIQACEQVLGTPIDATGDPSKKRSYYSTGFWAQITGYSGTLGYPLQYSWSELNESPPSGGFGSPPAGTQGVKSGGRSGTTSTNFAYNQYEIYGGQPTQPIANGTAVWMQYSFDASNNPFYRFFLFQLPPLGTYQSWYGLGGIVVADYIRAI